MVLPPIIVVLFAVLSSFMKALLLSRSLSARFPIPEARRRDPKVHVGFTILLLQDRRRRRELVLPVIFAHAGGVLESFYYSYARQAASYTAPG